MDPPSKPSLPTLQVLHSRPVFKKPSKCINEGTDVSHFLTTLAYRDICTFLFQLNHSVCPRVQAGTSPLRFPLTSRPSQLESVHCLQRLLQTIEGLIEEAPPDPGPRRFGNLSFRKWYSLFEERVQVFLSDGPIGQVLSDGAVEEVSSYLLGGFGSAQRLDYGTGHELSFLAFLGCLWKLGYFASDPQGGAIEREIVLQVIEPYLRVVRKIIITYTLEPAGSHGVWGLDDHSFLPYVFGSAQLNRPIHDAEPTPLEGSVAGAPKPSSVTNMTLVEDYRSTNMYFSAIAFIHEVKKGPFWEHSPMLFDISGIKDGWGKINKGMLKMFNAEVLSKFPVVQHFPFGSLFSWDKDPEAKAPLQSVHMANHPAIPGSAPQSRGTSSTGSGEQSTVTRAPWAR